MIGMDIQDQETQIKLEQRIGKYMEPQNWYLFEPDIFWGGGGGSLILFLPLPHEWSLVNGIYCVQAVTSVKVGPAMMALITNFVHNNILTSLPNVIWLHSSFTQTMNILRIYDNQREPYAMIIYPVCWYGVPSLYCDRTVPLSCTK